jgi:nitrogen fixation protein NifU and related proteins
MSDLRDLYQELILDHGKSPRNFRALPGASHHAKGYNPLCGDQVEMFVVLGDDGRVADVCFQGKGCAISTSSASLLTQTLKGKTPEEARQLFERFHDLITGTTSPDLEPLGKLAVFSGVRDYPNRAKCATLAWHTFIAALDKKQGPVSTE